MQKILLLAARIAILLGVGLIALAVFIDSSKVASLSTAKGAQDSFTKELDDRYKVPEPAKPVDPAMIPEPVKPGDNATDAEKSQYDKDLQAYQDLKKVKDDDYKKATADYEKARQKFAYDQKMMEYKKAIEKDQNEKLKKDIDNSIKEKAIMVNVIELSVIIRFIGSLLLILGSVGILLYAETMEKLGMLILLGFAFKTIIGL
jgi:hypothetical protein